MPRRSRPCRLETARKAGEQCRLGMRGGEGDTHPACGFDDARGDLDQVHPQGGELGCGERLRPGNGIADLEHQPVRAGVQHEADLIGERRSATGAVGRELCFVQFDQVFSLTAPTVETVIEPLGAATRDVGDDVTDVQSLGRRLAAGSDPSFAAPGLGAIAVSQ